MSFLEIINGCLYITEGICAIVAIYYIGSKIEKVWKKFAVYLILIFIFETVARFGFLPDLLSKKIYYNYLVIPFQFLFFYWLYGTYSLKKINLYLIFSLLYILSFIPNELFFKENKVVYSFNYTFGCLLLMILVVLEYYRQINSDNIIQFSKNRMFYINLGVSLFYIGTLPFWTFYLQLYDQNIQIWKIYNYYFQISGIIMYLLFAASFIWGKQNF